VEFGARKVLDFVSESSAEEVAYAIIRGAALRQRSVYYPYSVARVVPVAYQFIPCVFDKITAYLFARN